MTGELIHLIGAGGHARVVLDALLQGGCDPDRISVRDGRPGATLMGKNVAVPDVPDQLSGVFHVAIGAGSVREVLFEKAVRAGAEPMTVAHPAAVVSDNSRIEAGSFIAALAIVGPGVELGRGTIVNHAAIVDHDGRVGSFCHIAPGAVLGGAVTVGDRVLVGAGAVVLPGLRIASDVIVGAGAVVLSAIDEPGTWVGNPARRLTK